MHIPDAMLQGSICPVTAAFTAIGLSTAAALAYRAKVKPSSASFAAVTALIFAGQMLNFPVQFGTSGHLIGAAIAVALLGSSFGVLAMALVVAAQCLVFADGGISVLGANLFNMVLVASVPAIVVREVVLKKNVSAMFRNSAYAIAAWVSVVLAATACSTELAVAGTIPFVKVFPAMFSVHALIGIGETVLTLLACSLLMTNVEMVPNNRRSWLHPLGAAAVTALVLSPFASSAPDGLEWVAGTLGFLHESAPNFVAPFADYTVPAINSVALSTSLAGIAGVAILFAASYGVAKLFRLNV
jgi:cobalt/nickel transport system permease protein